MNEWVKSSLSCDDHFAVFFVTVRRNEELHRMFVNAMRQEPVTAILLVRTVVLAERPELVGCVIYFVGFDPNRQAWRIGVSHESLDAVPMGAEAKNLPINPEDENDGRVWGGVGDTIAYAEED